MIRIYFLTMKIFFFTILLILHVSESSGQSLPKGVTRLSSQGGRINFLFQDTKGDIWQGLYSINTKGKGLRKFSNNKWISVYYEGIFTDATEEMSKLYFSAYDGLYS